jgi:hypothetical protein
MSKTRHNRVLVCAEHCVRSSPNHSQDYRCLAIREPLRQLPLGDEAQLPFPTQDFGQGTYKLFGVVTNQTTASDQVIWCLRARCGKREGVHSAMKTNLAGGNCRPGGSAPTPHGGR